MKYGIALILALALVWVSWRLADVERQRYALFLGMCPSAMEGPQSLICLDTVKTRTSWLWNLYYGLKG